jgi:hypothetical protein
LLSLSLQGWVPVPIKDTFCVDLLEQTIRARSSALARWSSDRDLQGHYLRGCREFYSLACAVTGANFPTAFQAGKRSAAPRSWLPSAGSQRVEIHNGPGWPLAARGSSGPRPTPARSAGRSGQPERRAGLSLPAAGGAIGGYWALMTP